MAWSFSSADAAELPNEAAVAMQSKKAETVGRRENFCIVGTLKCIRRVLSIHSRLDEKTGAAGTNPNV